MKTILLSLITLVQMNIYAQSGYESAILKGQELLFKEHNYQEAANLFERVATKESTDWLPRYFESVTYALWATNLESADAKEEKLLAALDHANAAEKLLSNAEVLALKGFIQMLRISVDPMTRGQSLSQEVFSLLNKAIAMDASNPRAWLFLAQMQQGTAQFFGTDMGVACESFKKSAALFEQDEQKALILPRWGKAYAMSGAQKCEQ